MQSLIQVALTLKVEVGELFPLLKELKIPNQPLNAAGAMIWLHTARAAAEPELRIYGRKMWGS